MYILLVKIHFIVMLLDLHYLDFETIALQFCAITGNAL